MADEPKPPKRPTQSGRPSSTNRPRKSATAPVENARVSTLRDAVAHAVETDREFKKKSSITSGEGRGKLFSTLAAAALAFSAYSWIAKPAVIWGAPLALPAPEVQQANLRMSMFLFGMKVERFKKKSGTYPESLAAMGDSIRGIDYARLSDSTFELRGNAANQDVVFRSDMRAEDFLRNSKELIQARRTR